MEREVRTQETEVEEAPPEVMAEEPVTENAAAFTDQGPIPAVKGEAASAGPASASEQGYEPPTSPGVEALTYLLEHDHAVKPESVAALMKQYPDDKLAMFAVLHQKQNNGFVDEVVGVMEGPKETPKETAKESESEATKPEATKPEVAPEVAAVAAPAVVEAAAPVAAEVVPEVAAEAAAKPVVAEAIEHAPEVPVAAKTESPIVESDDAAELADAASPEKQESVISPDVLAMYVNAARAFLTRHLKLTHEQGELLQFDDEVAPDGGLCLEVTNIPEVVISKPEGQRNGTDSGYNDNFYASLPKDIQTPGMSHVAHVSLNGEPVDGKDGMVKIVGPTMQIQFAGEPMSS